MSLEGRTILITRPAEESSELASQLRERGARVIEAPSIEIVELEDTTELDRAVRMLAAGDFAWISFTSPRAVDSVLERVHRFGLPPRIPSRVAAVGPATAEKLAEAGVEVELVADPHTTNALAEAFPSGEGRVLFPRADIAPEGLEERFREKGWTPVRVDAYRTRYLEVLPDAAREALNDGSVDALVFTSASTVEGFVRMAGVRREPSVAIGPVTADAASRAGFWVDEVAEPHTVDGIVRALENLYP
ncbi:MAG: uroporphyrinogen-III synthase [Actinomycetota bacterium]